MTRQLKFIQKIRIKYLLSVQVLNADDNDMLESEISVCYPYLFSNIA